MASQPPLTPSSPQGSQWHINGSPGSTPLTPLPPPPVTTPPEQRRLRAGAEPPASIPASAMRLPHPYSAPDDATTLIIPPPPTPPRRRFGLWPRSLSWRLILIYTVLFAILLVALSVALNFTFSRALYRSDFSVFQSEAVTTVGAYKGRFDTLVCVDGMAYQQAFQEAIATPFSAANSLSAVYLLDSTGNLLA